MHRKSKESTYRFRISSLLFVGCVMTAYAMLGRAEIVSENEDRNTSIRSASSTVGNNSNSALRDAGIDLRQGLYPGMSGNAERNGIDNGW